MLRHIVVVCSLLLGSHAAFAYSTAQSSSSLFNVSNASTSAVEVAQQPQLALLSPEQRQAKRQKRQERRQMKAQQREQKRLQRHQQDPQSLRAQNGRRHSQKQNTSQKKQVASKPKRAPFVNKFPQTRPATGGSVFVFDPSITQWGAYDAEGNLVKSGRASGGRSYCPDIKSACRTPSGQYAVYRRGSASCKSKKFPVGKGGAPMPYCTFFSGGYAIHGSYHVPDYNASHGCIRVEPHMAKWLSDNFLHYGTTVIVKPYAK